MHDDLDGQHDGVSPNRWTQPSYAPIMASLQSKLRDRTLERHERQFFSRALEEVSALSGPVEFKPESWMITALDVDFGRRIGRGAL